jgi:hypothetical protein
MMSGVFSNPQPVTVMGYTDEVMEPFISNDGKFLFFNNSNAVPAATNIHVAKRINATTFSYIRKLSVNTDEFMDAAPSLDRNNNMYFITTRSYNANHKTIYRGVFANENVVSANPVDGLAVPLPGWLSMDAEISPDGNKLYFVMNQMGGPFGSPLFSFIKVGTRQADGSFVHDANSDTIMATLNATGHNYAPSLSRDGLEIYWTRASVPGSGPPVPGSVAQIYTARRASMSNPFGPATLIGAATGFVEGPTITADGIHLYYHKFNSVTSRYELHMLSR